MKGAGYGTLLTELKTRIHTAQYVALRAVNKELAALYWDIGKLIERMSHDYDRKTIYTGTRPTGASNR